VDGDVFAADSGNGLQQELGEIAEGDGLFLRDAALRRQKKNVAKGAIDVGGGGEIAAKGHEPFVWKPFEGGVRETVAATFTFLSRRMMDAKLCLLIAALAAVGKTEFAAGVG
jgi:hypothetical protein